MNYEVVRGRGRGVRGHEGGVRWVEDLIMACRSAEYGYEPKRPFFNSVAVFKKFKKRVQNVSKVQKKCSEER